VNNMSNEQLLNDEAQYIVQTYKRPSFIIDRGEGVYVYDTTGKRYTDWVAGIAVNALGYGDQGVTDAINAQLAKGIIHTSNLYYTEPQIKLAKKLVESSFADRVFFTNSGTEANEGAIKFARKVAYNKGLEGKFEMVTFSGAFHGRTMGSVTLTPKDKYQKPFKPLLEGVKVAEFNNIESATQAINDKTCAVFLEPVQGEGGINAATPEFLKALRELCDKHGALLVFDEVQCGMGRTGTLWAHEQAGVTPDIMTIAKPLGGGLPIGAILVTEAVAQAMQAGDHGSTFAGGAVVLSAALEVIDRINNPTFLAHVQETGQYLQESLEKLDSAHLQEVRGYGLMVAAEFDIDVSEIISKGFDAGLLMVNAGTNIIRFVPPLIIEKQHIDELVEKLQFILETL
jgi:acetylornithine/N-succinyldiaminopimelate aminotransferase